MMSEEEIKRLIEQLKNYLVKIDNIAMPTPQSAERARIICKAKIEILNLVLK